MTIALKIDMRSLINLGLRLLVISFLIDSVLRINSRDANRLITSSSNTIASTSSLFSPFRSFVKRAGGNVFRAGSSAVPLQVTR